MSWIPVPNRLKGPLFGKFKLWTVISTALRTTKLWVASVEMMSFAAVMAIEADPLRG
jgi:hypothetical protein